MNTLKQELYINIEQFMLTPDFMVLSTMHGPDSWKSYVVSKNKKLVCMTGGFEDNQDLALQNLNGLVKEYIKTEDEIMKEICPDES